MAKILATPGVYIVEKNAFPNSVVPVQTVAITHPAEFIVLTFEQKMQQPS